MAEFERRYDRERRRIHRSFRCPTTGHGASGNTLRLSDKSEDIWACKRESDLSRMHSYLRWSICLDEWLRRGDHWFVSTVSKSNKSHCRRNCRSDKLQDTLSSSISDVDRENSLVVRRSRVSSVSCITPLHPKMSLPKSKSSTYPKTYLVQYLLDRLRR